MTLSTIDTQLNSTLSYAECHYAKYQILFTIMLRVIMPNVIAFLGTKDLFTHQFFQFSLLVQCDLERNNPFEINFDG